MQNSSLDRSASQEPSPTPVPLIDLVREYQAHEKELAAAVLRVCASGRYVMGPDCQELESRLAGYVGAKHAIACASGSDAILLALLARDIGPGDEVIVPSYTFFATASAVARVGATPVFVEIDPTHYLIDTDAIARAVTSRTKAIIPVHLFGQCADMEAINRVAAWHKLHVIEDAAQAIGAEWRGARSGVLAEMACFSFYPTKNLGCFGDGGMLTTNDDALADRLRLLRAHGMQPRYYHQILGVNSRLDTIQAAILNVKLNHLDRWTAARQAVAERYTRMIGEAGLGDILGLPSEARDRRHVWNQYVVRVRDARRDALRQYLADRKVATEIYYPVPLHLQACFANLGHGVGSLPISERAAAETLALPIFPELTADEQWVVVRQMAAFFGVSTEPAGHTLRGPNYLKHAPSAAAKERKAG